MDIVFDPPGSGMFSEVYLYEEQMEADLHAIVRHSFLSLTQLMTRSVPANLYQTHTFNHSSTKPSVDSRYVFRLKDVEVSAEDSTSTLQKSYIEI